MAGFHETAFEQFDRSPFRLFGRDWALITTGDEKGVNTMTASWGGMGVLWSKNVAFIFVRHSRYTFEFIERCGGFSVCFPGSGRRREFNYCGSVSGRDEDKIKKCGFTVQYSDGVPYIAEAEKVLICRKLYSQDIEPEHFADQTLDSAHYPTKDYHRMYVGEIVKILEK